MVIFDVERWADVLVLTPLRDLRELEFEEIRHELLPLSDDLTIRRVVVDFRHTDYLGSTAVGLLVHLFLKVRQRGGRMALCNVSAHEHEIFELVGLGDMLPTYASRKEALAALGC
jgi:stage II sporulation protein AA (anti-sigma F factor antagonist)